MVDRDDLPEINALVIEYNAIRQAIINIDAGGSITSMVINGPLPAQVVTTYMKAPSIMYQTLVELMEERRREISTQLDDLGVRP